MAFDFKKEYREIYLPDKKPDIILVPKMNYIAVRGQGDPNQEDGEYKQAIGPALWDRIHYQDEQKGRPSD